MKRNILEHFKLVSNDIIMLLLCVVFVRHTYLVGALLALAIVPSVCLDLYLKLTGGSLTWWDIVSRKLRQGPTGYRFTEWLLELKGFVPQELLVMPVLYKLAAMLWLVVAALAPEYYLCVFLPSMFLLTLWEYHKDAKECDELKER